MSELTNIASPSVWNVGILLLVINLIASYKGLKDPIFFQRYYFRVDSILIKKDYKRLLTSGFLHGSWMHLGFNMLALYSFSEMLEWRMGSTYFLGIYFASLLGGSLASLYIHRNHGDYTAIGASGAVSGIIFSSIALFPGIEISLLFIPIGIPGWLFGLAYVLVSINGIKSQKGNIGHDAHLGGGLIGLWATIALYPDVLSQNPIPILLITIPSVAFIYLILTKPEILILGSWTNKKNYTTVDDRFNSKKKEAEVDIDRILDKISAKGMDSLTKKEKAALDHFSGKDKD